MSEKKDIVKEAEQAMLLIRETEEVVAGLRAVAADCDEEAAKNARALELPQIIAETLAQRIRPEDIPLASVDEDGLMSATDKEKLDNLEGGLEIKLDNAVKSLNNKIDDLLLRVEAIELQMYEYHVKPGVVNRLKAIGYEDADIERAYTAVPLMAEADVERREQLATLNYDPTEIEDCIEDVPELTYENIDYAKSILDSWNPALTKISYTWNNDTNIVIFPKIDTSSVTAIDHGWYNNKNLSFFPKLDYSNVTSIRYPFNKGNNMRRYYDYDLSKVTSFTAGFLGGPRLEIGPSAIRLPSAKSIAQVFRWWNNVWPLPEFEFDPEKITETLSNVFGDTQITDLPITNFRNATNIEGVYADCENLPEDLSDYEIYAPKAIQARKFFNSCNFTKAPLKLTFHPGVIMTSFFSSSNLEEVPDYTNLEPSSLNDFVDTFNSTRLKAIRGLNFARYVSYDKSLDWIIDYPLLGHKDWYHFRNLTYIRIINLGMSEETDYNFIHAINWGYDEEGFQSLIDTLITDSYDRAANGMETATIRLHKSVIDRLSDEHIAQITAKGFTILAL